MNHCTDPQRCFLIYSEIPQNVDFAEILCYNDVATQLYILFYYGKILLQKVFFLFYVP